MAWSCEVTVAQNFAGFAHYNSADLAAKEKEIVRKVNGNRPSFVVLGKTAGTTSALIYRAATGEAELHENESDFFVVRSGHATLVIGGRLKDSRVTGPGELAAASIEGGERRPIAAGDVVYIPAKLPHHVLIERGAPILYLIIKAKE